MIDKGIKYDDIPQLAKPKKGSKRQGFRGPGGYQGGSGGDYGGGYSGGNTAGPGDTGGEGGDSPQDESTSQFGSGDDRREQYSVTRTVTPKDKEVKVAPPSPVERNTGLEKTRLANIALAENLKNTKYEDVQTTIPPFIPYSGVINTGLNVLGSFGFEKNKDFFQENVAGKYGYGYGLEDFEQYMEDRLSGKVGAYGNENMGQNALSRPDDNDRQDTASGILEALLISDPDSPLLPTSPTGFNYVPYSNQVVVAPGREGLASLTGGQGFLSSIV